MLVKVFLHLKMLKDFYRAYYAKQNSFEIKIKTSRKHMNSNDICCRLYQCRKAEKPKI